jgi:hypothetical protein
MAEHSLPEPTRKPLTQPELERLLEIAEAHMRGESPSTNDLDFLARWLGMVAGRSGMNNAETVRCNLCELTQEETSLSQYECTDGPVYYCADCERSLFASEERGKRD